MTTAVLLTVPELQQHIETDLAAPALQRLLDSEEAEIVRRYGPHDDAVFVGVGGGAYLFLPRPAAEVTTITETGGYVDPLELEEDDYELLHGGRTVRRLSGGTNSAARWSPTVSVVYVPLSDTDQRRRVLVDLCRLDLQNNALAIERVGDYTAHSKDYQRERERLLRSLSPRTSVIA